MCWGKQKRTSTLVKCVCTVKKMERTPFHRRLKQVTNLTLKMVEYIWLHLRALVLSSRDELKTTLHRNTFSEAMLEYRNGIEVMIVNNKKVCLISLLPTVWWEWRGSQQGRLLAGGEWSTSWTWGGGCKSLVAFGQSHLCPTYLPFYYGRDKEEAS